MLADFILASQHDTSFFLVEIKEAVLYENGVAPSLVKTVSGFNPGINFNLGLKLRTVIRKNLTFIRKTVENYDWKYFRLFFRFLKSVERHSNVCIERWALGTILAVSRNSEHFFSGFHQKDNSLGNFFISNPSLMGERSCLHIQWWELKTLTATSEILNSDRTVHKPTSELK